MYSNSVNVTTFVKRRPLYGKTVVSDSSDPRSKTGKGLESDKEAENKKRKPKSQLSSPQKKKKVKKSAADLSSDEDGDEIIKEPDVITLESDDDDILVIEKEHPMIRLADLTSSSHSKDADGTDPQLTSDKCQVKETQNTGDTLKAAPDEDDLPLIKTSKATSKEKKKPDKSGSTDNRSECGNARVTSNNEAVLPKPGLFYHCPECQLFGPSAEVIQTHIRLQHGVKRHEPDSTSNDHVDQRDEIVTNSSAEVENSTEIATKSHFIEDKSSERENKANVDKKSEPNQSKDNFTAESDKIPNGDQEAVESNQMNKNCINDGKSVNEDKGKNSAENHEVPIDERKSDECRETAEKSESGAESIIKNADKTVEGPESSKVETKSCSCGKETSQSKEKKEIAVADSDQHSGDSESDRNLKSASDESQEEIILPGKSAEVAPLKTFEYKNNGMNEESRLSSNEVMGKRAPKEANIMKEDVEILFLSDSAKEPKQAINTSVDEAAISKEADKSESSKQTIPTPTVTHQEPRELSANNDKTEPMKQTISSVDHQPKNDSGNPKPESEPMNQPIAAASVIHEVPKEPSTNNDSGTSKDVCEASKQTIPMPSVTDRGSKETSFKNDSRKAKYESERAEVPIQMLTTSLNDCIETSAVAEPSIPEPAKIKDNSASLKEKVQTMIDASVPSKKSSESKMQDNLEHAKEAVEILTKIRSDSNEVPYSKSESKRINSNPDSATVIISTPKSKSVREELEVAEEPKKAPAEELVFIKDPSLFESFIESEIESEFEKMKEADSDSDHYSESVDLVSSEDERDSDKKDSIQINEKFDAKSKALESSQVDVPNQSETIRKDGANKSVLTTGLSSPELGSKITETCSVIEPVLKSPYSGTNVSLVPLANEGREENDEESERFDKEVRDSNNDASLCRCGNCDKMFFSIGNFTRHTRDCDTGEGILKNYFNCLKCLERKEDVSALKSHSCQGSRFKIGCPRCVAKFTDGKALLRHMIKWHENSKSFNCQACNDFTFTRKRFFVHLTKCNEWKKVKGDVASEVQNAPSTTSVPMEKETWTDMVDVDDYINEIKDAAFNCPLCENSFSVVVDLVEHMQRDHEEAKSFNCKKCKNLVKSVQTYFNFHLFCNEKESNETIERNTKDTEIDDVPKIRSSSQSGIQESESRQKVDQNTEQTETEVVPQIQSSSPNELQGSESGQNSSDAFPANKPMRCPFCPAYYTTKRIILHVMKWHRSGGAFQCPRCKRRYNGSGDLLSEHLLMCAFKLTWKRFEQARSQLLERFPPKTEKAKYQVSDSDECATRIIRLSEATRTTTNQKTKTISENPVEIAEPTSDANETKKKKQLKAASKARKVTETLNDVGKVQAVEKPSKCHICGYIPASASRLKLHFTQIHRLEMTEKDRFDEEKCLDCGIAQCGFKHKNLPCPYCLDVQGNIGTMHRLHEHLLRWHRDDNSPTLTGFCGLCGSTQNFITRHIKDCHEWGVLNQKAVETRIEPSIDRQNQTSEIQQQSSNVQQRPSFVIRQQSIVTKNANLQQQQQSIDPSNLQRPTFILQRPIVKQYSVNKVQPQQKQPSIVTKNTDLQQQQLSNDPSNSKRPIPLLQRPLVNTAQPQQGKQYLLSRIVSQPHESPRIVQQPVQGTLIFDSQQQPSSSALGEKPFIIRVTRKQPSSLSTSPNAEGDLSGSPPQLTIQSKKAVEVVQQSGPVVEDGQSAEKVAAKPRRVQPKRGKAKQRLFPAKERPKRAKKTSKASVSKANDEDPQETRSPKISLRPLRELLQQPDLDNLIESVGEEYKKSAAFHFRQICTLCYKIVSSDDDEGEAHFRIQHQVAGDKMNDLVANVKTEESLKMSGIMDYFGCLFCPFYDLQSGHVEKHIKFSHQDKEEAKVEKVKKKSKKKMVLCKICAMVIKKKAQNEHFSAFHPNEDVDRLEEHFEPLHLELSKLDDDEINQTNEVSNHHQESEDPKEYGDDEDQEEQTKPFQGQYEDEETEPVGGHDDNDQGVVNVKQEPGINYPALICKLCCLAVADAESALNKHLTDFHTTNLEEEEKNAVFNSHPTLKVSLGESELFGCLKCQFIATSSQSIVDHNAAEHKEEEEKRQQTIVKKVRILYRRNGTKTVDSTTSGSTSPSISSSSSLSTNGAQSSIGGEFPCVFCDFSCDEVELLKIHMDDECKVGK